jgi:uncharacterized alpha-E superfamily protein
MLARVADALYWMGRYLERAENTTRLLLVTEELSTEVVGLDEDLARAEWEHLLLIFPGAGMARPPAATPGDLAIPYVEAFWTDPANPYSVAHSLRRARDNARTVREAITLEVFITLNDTYRDLRAQAGRRVEDPATFRAALAGVHRGLLGTVGAIEHTLSRDEGWLFLKLGESLERLFRTAAILRAKLPPLVAAEPKLDLPLVYTQWRSLLRSLSALENYRQAYGARLEPADVVAFTFFSPHTPRSLHYGAHAVKGYLERLDDRAALTLPARVMGKLAAELAYQDQDILGRQDHARFLDRVLEQVGRTHDALAARYFGG